MERSYTEVYRVNQRAKAIYTMSSEGQTRKKSPSREKFVAFKLIYRSHSFSKGLLVYLPQILS